MKQSAGKSPPCAANCPSQGNNGDKFEICPRFSPIAEKELLPLLHIDIKAIYV